MKHKLKGLLLATLLAGSFTMQAQTVADVKKMYDYARFESAAKLAAPLAATNAEANYYLGLSQLALDKLTDAQATFAKYPTDIANISGTARLLYTQKKNTEALALLTGIVAKAKKKDWQTYKMAADAITYTQNKDTKKSIEWYTKALEINQNGDTYMGLGDAYMNVLESSGGGNAETNYIYALDYKANPSQIAYRRGNLWLSAREYDSAIVNYKRCTELDASNPLPFINFANSYYKTNRFELAKKNMESYMKLSDNTPDDYQQYVNIIFLCKDYTGTIAKVAELNKMGVSKPYLNRISAISNYEIGNTAAALTDMNTFFDKQDKTKVLPTDYKYFAKILAKTPGREAEANGYFVKAIDLDTAADKSESYRSLAEDAKAKKDYVGAAAWFDKLIEKSPATSITANDYYYGGFCNYAAKNYPAAIKNFSVMTEKYPTEPSGFYYLATSNALKDGGTKTGSALEPYKKYAEMIGVNPEKKDNLTKAYSYIIEYYYNKKDGANATMFANKLIEVDATNSYATQVINFFKGAKTPTAAKPAVQKKK